MKTKCFIITFAVLAAVSSCKSEDDTVEQESPKTVETKEVKTTYANFLQDYFRVGSNDKTLRVPVKTDGTGDSLYLGYYRNAIIKDEDVPAGDTKATRAEEMTGYFELDINPNTDAHSRTTEVYLYDTTNKDVADTAVIVQDGTALRTSTDFSKDGEVEMLSAHTKGSGIPVVIMGDAFGDSEVADGTYKTTMRQAIDNMFSEQPMTALRDYFDVYMVYAVSKNNDVGPVYDTVFGTVMPSDGTTEVDGDDSMVDEYYSKVLDKYKSQIKNEEDVFLIVVLNNNNYAGTTYMYQDNKGTPVNYSIAYCPVIDSLKSENFRRVMVHEVAGHGFAKLGDEYAYERQGAAPAEDRVAIDEVHGYGWYMNVSTTNDSIKAPWAQFLKDEDYKTEKIGFYEGGYTYWTGVWRPTEKSMMNSNNYPFNAPSRLAIYKQVMKLGAGTTPAYDEFKTFDLANYPDYDKYMTGLRGSRAVVSPAGKPFGKPKIKVLSH